MRFSLTKETSNAVKVLAALMVMFHHYSQYVMASGLSDSIIYKILSTQGGFVGVAIFFFLSGFGLMESEQKSHLSLSTFFKRRFLKVYLPVLLATILWMIVSPILLTTSPFDGIEISIGDIKFTIGNFLFDFGDEVLWFVKALFILYVEFYLFSLVYIHNHKVGIAFLITAVLLTTILEAELFAKFSSISIPYFALGVIMSIYKNRELPAILSAIAALICFAACGFFYYTSDLAAHSAANAISLGIFILILSVRQWEIRFPALLGVMSFDFYLIHNKVLQTMKLNMDVAPLWMFVLITFGVTYLFYMLRTKVFKI